MFQCPLVPTKCYQWLWFSVADDEEDLTLTEDQVVDGRIAVSEAQVVDSGQVMSEVIHIQRQEEEMEESEMESEGIMTMAEWPTES